MEEEIQEIPTSPVQPVLETPVLPRRRFNLKIIAILFVVISLITIGVVFGMQIGKKQVAGGPLTKVTPTLVPQPTGTPASDETANWKTYRDDEYGFEFKYPESYSLKSEKEEIKISAPLSKCNPKLRFNINEHETLEEVKIIFKRRHGSLAQILEVEGGVNYGWGETRMANHKGYFIAVGAEMIAPLERYLVEIDPNSVLDIQSYTFGSDDMGKCNPKLDGSHAEKIKDQILSTFKFLE